jgi:hypothetical protein
MASLGSSCRQRVIVTAIMLPLLVDEIAASVWLLGRIGNSNMHRGYFALVVRVMANLGLVGVVPQPS